MQVMCSAATPDHPLATLQRALEAAKQAATERAPCGGPQRGVLSRAVPRRLQPQPRLEKVLLVTAPPHAQSSARPSGCPPGCPERGCPPTWAWVSDQGTSLFYSQDDGPSPLGGVPRSGKWPGREPEEDLGGGDALLLLGPTCRAGQWLVLPLLLPCVVATAGSRAQRGEAKSEGSGRPLRRTRVFKVSPCL